MSVAIDAEASAKIELLRQQFVRRMRDDANVIQAFLDGIGSQTLAGAELGPLRKICHSLVGAAGVFGFPVVAEAASRLSAALASGERDGARLGAMARALVEDIRAASVGF